MDAVQRRGSPERLHYIKRLGCLLLAMLLCFQLMQPPRVRAVALVDDVAILISAIMNTCGLNLHGPDMSSIGNAINSFLSDFLATEMGGQSLAQWLGNHMQNVYAVVSGDISKIVIPQPLAEKFTAFINWLIGKKNIQPEVDLTVTSKSSFVAADGNTYFISTVPEQRPGIGWFEVTDYSLGTVLFTGSVPLGTHTIDILPGHTWSFIFTSSSFKVYTSFPNHPHGGILLSFGSGFSAGHYSAVTFYVTKEGFLTLGLVNLDGKFCYSISEKTDITAADLGLVEKKVVISPADTITVPNTGAMENDDSLVIDTGIPFAPDATLDDVISGVGESIGAGDFAGSNSITQNPAIPSEGTMVGDIALEGVVAAQPSLSAVFTTRFPFSIPWDLKRAVQLLAAPGEAPYWELDFMAPLANNVGGWVGDTTIVIDMAEYEIVGQVCRWMSTLLFVAALITGTKRLIWTA